MLRDKIELARVAFDAFSRRDVEAALAIAHPDIEFYAPTGELADEEGPHREAGAYWGHEGLRAYFIDVGRLWNELDAWPEEFRETGDHLLVLGRVRGQTKEGARLDIPVQWVWRIRDGRISYWGVYTDLSEALQAVGMPDEEA